jgi:hypothetical protein
MAIVTYNKQLKPLASTLSTILTTIELTVLSEIIACNESAVADTIRILIKENPLDPDIYVVYDLAMLPNSTYTAEFRDYFITGTVVKVYSTNGTTSFTLLSYACNP